MCNVYLIFHAWTETNCTSFQFPCVLLVWNVEKHFAHMQNKPVFASLFPFLSFIFNHRLKCVIMVSEILFPVTRPHTHPHTNFHTGGVSLFSSSSSFIFNQRKTSTTRQYEATWSNNKKLNGEKAEKYVCKVKWYYRHFFIFLFFFLAFFLSFISFILSSFAVVLHSLRGNCLHSPAGYVIHIY